MMKVESQPDARSDGALLHQLVPLLLTMIVGMTAYEWLNPRLLPDISPSASQLLTIAFSSLLATLAAFYLARRKQARDRNMPAEVSRVHDPSAELALPDRSARPRESDNAGLYERAQHLAAQEERQRLARELHDSVSQALYGIQLGATTAREMLGTDLGEEDLKSALVEPLDYVVSLADAGLAEMRALIFDLRPESLATEGLVAGLTKQIASTRARHGIAVEAALCPEPDVTLEVKETLYRIAQEALHNTIKHAQASRVDLNLDCDADAIRMEIRDDGKGFQADASYPGHLGLRSMRERAERLGGELNVESSPDSGTHIRVRIPLTPAPAEGAVP